MIGTAERARSRRHTSRPSILGSITSSTTRSKVCSAKRASASRPSDAVHDLVAVALQRERQQGLDRLLVVDQQDPRGAVWHCEDSVDTVGADTLGRARRPGLPGGVHPGRWSRSSSPPSRSRTAPRRSRRRSPRPRFTGARAFDTLLASSARRSRERRRARPATARSPSASPTTFRGERLPRQPQHRSGRTVDGEAELETVVGVRPGPVEPAHRRAGPPRRARLARAGRAVGDGGAAGAGASVQGARPLLDAGARLDLGRQRRRRGRARVRRARRRRPDRRGDRARRPRRRRIHKPWIVPWSNDRDAAADGAAAHARERGPRARSGPRRAARARSASGRGARCR